MSYNSWLLVSVCIFIFCLLQPISCVGNLLVYNGPETGPDYCARYGEIGTNLGYSVTVNSDATLPDLSSYDLVIDCEILNGCLTPTESTALDNFLNNGKSVLLQSEVDGTTLSSCVRNKVDLVNNHIADGAISVGANGVNGCSFNSEANLAFHSKAVAGFGGDSITCGGPGTIDGVDENSTLLRDGAGAVVAGIWGDGDTIDGSGIVLWADYVHLFNTNEFYDEVGGVIEYLMDIAISVNISLEPSLPVKTNNANEQVYFASMYIPFEITWTTSESCMGSNVDIYFEDSSDNQIIAATGYDYSQGSFEYLGFHSILPYSEYLLIMEGDSCKSETPLTIYIVTGNEYYAY